MNKESENRGKTFREHCMKIFGSHELCEISTTPNCCKKKIKKYRLLQSKGLPNIKRKKKKNQEEVDQLVLLKQIVFLCINHEYKFSK